MTVRMNVLGAVLRKEVRESGREGRVRMMEPPPNVLPDEPDEPVVQPQIQPQPAAMPGIYPGAAQPGMPGNRDL